MSEPDKCATDAEQLALDEAGIEAAAMALCFAGRPVLPMAPPYEIDASSWWQMQTEIDRRLYLYRARVAVEAWCLWEQSHEHDA